MMSLKYQVGAATLLIGLAAWLSSSAYWNKPALRSVDGIYRSGCCAEIVINDGLFSYGSKAFKFDLSRMKYGLTASVYARFTMNGGTSSSDPTDITFFNHARSIGFTLPIDRHDYVFVREDRDTTPVGERHNKTGR
jgi:hypothetical protein